MQKTISILNPWLSVIFAIAAALQWNDPDPYLWIPMYGAAMVACILQAMKRLRPWMSGAVGLVALVWAIAIAPEALELARFGDMFQSMKASNPPIESAREFGGLLIVATWMGILTLGARRK
jgi:hypothetical protein